MWDDVSPFVCGESCSGCACMSDSLGDCGIGTAPTPSGIGGVVAIVPESMGDNGTEGAADFGRAAGMVGSGVFQAETVCSMRAERAELPGRFNDARKSSSTV